MVQDVASVSSTEDHTFHLVCMTQWLHVYEYVCMVYISVLIAWQERDLTRIIFYR
jgi:hypothetical protein